MKTSHRRLMLASALATSLAVASPFTIVHAEDGAKLPTTLPTDPGFNPGTGQINTGLPDQAPSSSSDFRKVPTSAEIRAALMVPDDPTLSLGAEPAQPQNNSGNKTVSQQGGGGDPTTSTRGQAAIGGPLSPGASAGSGSDNSSNQGNSSGPGPSASPGNETTGHRPGGDVKQNQSGPIGATGQTMPAKFSARNDVLDRAPIMAFTPKLSDQDRQQILQAVMADKSQVAADADTLQPASELSTSQALNDMHALPESVSGHLRGQ